MIGSTAGFGTVAVNENTNVGNLRVFATCGEVACNFETTDMLQFSPAAVGLQVVDHVTVADFSYLAKA